MSRAFGVAKKFSKVIKITNDRVRKGSGGLCEDNGNVDGKNICVRGDETTEFLISAWEKQDILYNKVMPTVRKKKMGNLLNRVRQEMGENLIKPVPSILEISKIEWDLLDNLTGRFASGKISKNYIFRQGR